MTDIATVRVQILGREFPVACPAGQEQARSGLQSSWITECARFKKKPGIVR